MSLPVLTISNSRKRERDDTGNTNQPPVNRNDSKFGTGVETNEHRISVRLKQIQFGKNTIGYDNYLAAVPKTARVKYSVVHPRTPDPYEESSKRQFDGRIKAWRRELHKWDSMEQIAQVEVQVERAAAPHSGQMDGVAVTGVTPLIVTAPVGAPGCGKVVTGKPAAATTAASATRGERGSGGDAGRCCGSEEEEVGHSTKRTRLADGSSGTPCIGEDEDALDGVDYDWGGEGDSRDGFPTSVAGTGTGTAHWQQQQPQQPQQQATQGSGPQAEYGDDEDVL